ncbi:YceI family protein [Rickettsiales bacterium]|nr:YceI family protein [Rickettsiales bacterium]MDB2550436.1 YceI family protein [Rickettsiales bacterium]
MLKIIKIYISFIIFNIILINNSYSANYVINQEKSIIDFSGIHAGNKFTGNIGKYQAKIDFDQNNLKNSQIEVIFDMANFKTGNDMYDGTLPTKDWFDIKNHPKSYFKSKKIIKKNANYYIIGDLTIKNITKEVKFDFDLKNIEKNSVSVKSNFNINRLDYNIGIESDPDGQWVDLKININLNLIAKSE